MQNIMRPCQLEDRLRRSHRHNEGSIPSRVTMTKVPDYSWMVDPDRSIPCEHCDGTGRSVRANAAQVGLKSRVRRGTSGHPHKRIPRSSDDTPLENLAGLGE